MSNLLQSCWAAHGQLLSAEGLSEHHLQQVWQAVCSGISSSVQQGRGHKVPGICTVLPRAAGQPGIKVLLSDTLLKAAPGMQLGKGCVHHASVRQQVQGVETLNTAKLAHRCSQGLSQDAIRLAVRVLTDTVAKQLTARQGCTIDLGVGQLRFCSRSTPRAEFTARLGCQQHTAAAPAQQPAAPAGVPPAAASMGQPCISLGGGSSNSSTCSNTSPAAAPKACGHLRSPAVQAAACRPPAAAAAAAITCGYSGSGVPEKPSNCVYDPVAAWDVAREVRTAAAQNARVKAAAFVLPAGGPDDDGAGEPRMPQGKGQVSAQATFGQQQVVAAAAARLQQEKAARAAQEAATVSMQAVRLKALNKQAQTHVQRKRAQKQKLAADLTQQVRDKATRAPGKLDGGSELALVVSGKPDAAALKALKLRQQAEYRSCLDAQNASKGKGGCGQHADQQAAAEQETQQQQQHRQMLRTALGSDP